MVWMFQMVWMFHTDKQYHKELTLRAYFEEIPIKISGIIGFYIAWKFAIMLYGNVKRVSIANFRKNFVLKLNILN